MPQRHISHTRLAPSFLREHSVNLKLKKCAIFANKIYYLGLVICPCWSEVGNQTTDAIRDVNILTAQTELHSFIGSCNAFCRFVSNFACIAPSLATRLHESHAKELGHLKMESCPLCRLYKKNFFLPQHQRYPRKIDDTPSTQIHVIDKYAVRRYKQNTKMSTNQSNIGQGSCTTETRI